MLIQYKKQVGLTAAAFLFVMCLGHHIFDMWDKAAVSIAGIFFLFFLFFLGILPSIFPPFASAFGQMRSKWVLLIPSAVVFGSLFSLLLYKAPVSYQTLTLTPSVSEGQQVELLKVTVDGVVIPLETQAVKNGWRSAGGVMTALPGSLPLSVIFQAPVLTRVEVFLQSLPEGGDLKLSLQGATRGVSLSSSSHKQERVILYSQYRFLPNLLFVPLLFFADLFTFSALFLALFVLQERGKLHALSQPREKFLSKRASLLILIGLAGLLHLFSALAVPLIVDSDSPSYLQGALYYLEYGNLDGVSMIRGPGSTFLFAPVLFFFGRNPWGMKLLLHLIALACVLISYRLAWQLSKRRSVAFTAGLLTMLLPDLYYYANYVMAELPNLMLVGLFSTLLLDALDNRRILPVFLSFLAGSLAALLRSENILLLFIGLFCLGIQPAWSCLKGILHKTVPRQPECNGRSLGILLLAFGLALIPLFWWSAHNLRVHGFFGLSNYASEVLYDGWIYYPEASGFDFRSKDSPAVLEIDKLREQYSGEVTDQTGVATGWEIYPSLISAGFSSDEAFDLLGQAALDSIWSSRALVPAILKIKVKDAFRPVIFHWHTFPLAGEIAYGNRFEGIYFDSPVVRIAPLIKLQRVLNDLFKQHLARIYRAAALFGLVSVFFGLYRMPFIPWLSLALIVLTRIFVSNLMGLSYWRYTIAGIVLLVVFGVTALATLLFGIKDLFFKTDHQAAESSANHPAG